MTERRSRPYEFPIERGKILEFARAIKSSNPAFLGVAPIIPPTFLMVGGQIWGYSWEHPGDSPMADVGVDSARSLHLEETYEFSGPLPSAGELLEGELVLLEPVEKVGRRSGPMTIWTTETRYRRADGSCAALARQVIAQLEAAQHGADEGEEQLPADPPPADEARETARRYGPIRLEDVIQYQAASGDLNPHHYDREILAASGFTRFFLPGMLPAGLLGGQVADLYGAERVRRVSFSFRELVFVGDTITTRVEPTDGPAPDGALTLDLACLRGDGRTAVSGSAVIAG